MKNQYLKVTFVSVAIILLPQIANAEAKVGERFGDWIFECAAIAEDKTACAITQTISSQKDNRRIVKLSVGRNEKKGANMLTALLPLGVHIPTGVTSSIDQTAIPLAIQTCLAQGCIATHIIDNNSLKALQNGQKLNINFATGGGKQPVSIAGSLTGLADGLKAANIK